PAQGVVFQRGTPGAFLRGPVRVEEGDLAGDPVRTVLGHLDRRPAGAAPVHLVPGLDGIDGVAQRPRRAVADGTDDLVHPAAARGDERLGAGAERGGEPAGAQTGVLADAPVVVDRQLLARIGVPPVWDPLGILGTGEPAAGAAAVTGRLDRR